MIYILFILINIYREQLILPYFMFARMQERAKSSFLQFSVSMR